MLGIADLAKRELKFNTIFCDPDYNVGIVYENGTKTKINFDEYIEWCSQWARYAYEQLTENGNMFIINYPKNNAHLRVKWLEKYVKEKGGNIHEYVWVYNTNVGMTQNRFTRAHRTILHLTKSKKNDFYKDQVAEPYKNPEDSRIQKLIKAGSKGRMPYSWIYLQQVKNVEKTDIPHPCLIPPELTEKLFRATTKPGNNILILFAGSGNDMLSSVKLKCNTYGIEINEDYCKLIKQRIKQCLKKKK